MQISSFNYQGSPDLLTWEERFFLRFINVMLLLIDF